MTIRVLSPTLKITPEGAFLRRIRVRTQDSALVYNLFESHEGIVGYSTLDFKPGDAYRDLELTIPLGFLEEVTDLLRELGDLIYEIDLKK